MSNRITNIIAASLLIFVFIVTVSSMAGDSLTMDELAHLPAGYSYLTQKDMRLNPEHPPLIKDLSAIPLIFIKNIKFPYEIKAWKEDVNGQWDFGNNLLFKNENPADKMIFWGRIPMIFVLLLLGFYIFKWARELFGNKAAIFALFLFSFSPTFLAHGKFVTTDVGAATGFLIATYYFIKCLKNPTNGNIIKAGISLGLAELTKFSLVILIPFFILLVFIWGLIKLENWKKLLKMIFLIFFIAYLVVGLFYTYHVWNYPIEKQREDTKFLLSSFGSRFLANLTVWMAGTPILRIYAQYLLGLLMVMQRSVGGNTTYFLEQVSGAGWKNYFPIVYSIKEPLSFHILTIIAALYGAWRIKDPFWKNSLERIKKWVKDHFAEFAMLSLIAIYWASSLTSHLNIGVRHLLPTFPFVILLVSGATSSWLKQNFLKVKYIFLGSLMLWQIISVISVYPYFLAYFNEIVGGPDKGYIYVTDSNLDWGQDLKRLKNWVEKNNINKIYVDYFGGADVKYYLKEKFEPWWGSRDPKELPKESYLAVSATFLQGGRGEPAPGFDQPTGYYNWLNQYNPVAKIGYSIFVYRIP
jgi:hypothetical protein